MSAQINEQFTTFTHQFAAAAARANRLALENAETVFGVQLKTFEKNVEATTAFFGELSEIHTAVIALQHGLLYAASQQMGFPF